jgi:RecG-like helicase
MEQFVITKKIAKHGSQAVIIIPRILENELKPKTIAKITIDVLKTENAEIRQYIITKKIAKHGSQSIIIVPRILENELKPSTIVKLTIDILKKETGKNGREVGYHPDISQKLKRGEI